MVAVDIPPSEAVVGQLHPVSAGPGQFREAECATRVTVVSFASSAGRGIG